ncbi:NAD(P)-binding protein [Gautieria morchelliformis]|nr:NAD(P)-binding protein [Gautieria morchelliformis]
MSTDKRKSVLITGCSTGGIGSYLAKGLRVFATARRLSAMEDLRELDIECLQLDVTKNDNIKQIRDEITELTGGTLDILVNNAYVLVTCYSLPFTDANMDEVRAMFDINLFGAMAMVQAFVNLLIESGDGRSVSAIIPMAFGAPYAAAKAGLHAYGNTLRVELAPFKYAIISGGVKSNIASPQHIRSLPPNSIYQPMVDDFVNKRTGRSQRGATPTDVYARSVVAATLKAHPKAWVWSGNLSFLTWFLDTFFPRTIFDFLVAREFGLDKFTRIIRQRKKTQ